MSDKNIIHERMDKDYGMGFQLGVNVIEDLGFETKENPSREHFVGILSSFFNCMYHLQNQDAVNEVIEFAKEIAIEEVKECRGKDT
ncbi:hypothetical protein [Winogradskyella sp.]|uniref:hypothetical protein n=1 Tax=Winogradskyella sp. TaxID=1883156 RepID=UPI0035113B98